MSRAGRVCLFVVISGGLGLGGCSRDVPNSDGGDKTQPDACASDADCVGVIVVGDCQKVVCADHVCTAAADTTANGTDCDDGAYCTVGETCTDGTCGGGTPIDCSAFDDGDCGVGACDEINQTCVTEAAPPSTACDDGDPCTEGDMCDGTSCVGTAKDCSSLDDQCNSGVCNGGTCEAVALTDQICNDSEACTLGDTCTNQGTCVGAWDEVSCGCNSDDSCGGLSDECNTGRCNVLAHQCYAEPNVGNFCDDSDLCTANDQCSVTGACVGTSHPCTPPLSCQTSTCDGNGGCDVATINGFCVINNTCYADGASNPANPCQWCASAQSQTSWKAKPNDTPCNADTDGCTADDSCQAGTCTPGSPVVCPDDGEPCTTQACQSTGPTSYTCAAVPDPTANGAACDDGAYCTVGETCTDGTCGGGASMDCSAFDVGDCGVGACNEIDHCVTVAAPPLTTCNDGDPCTEGDMCNGTSCIGTAKDCSSLDDQCNSGVCNGGTCEAVALTDQVCNDSEACTLGDTCTAQGACVGVWDEVSCGCNSDASCTSLSDECNTGRCNVVAHQCYAEPNAGNFCDDSDLCTANDQCSVTGACVGTSYPCTPPLSCQTSTCDGNGGCDVATINGFCVINNTCYADGASNPANPCQWCAAAQSQADWSPKPNGTLCNADTDGCTLDDSCQAGTCTAGSPVVCPDDGLSCTSETCQSTGSSSYTCNAVANANGCLISGSCYDSGVDNPSNPCQSCEPATTPAAWSNKGNGTVCDADGDGCTQGDACADGTCVAGSAADCSDGLACTVDVCTSMGSDTYTCANEVAAGFCTIAGACWAAGVDNPGNSCQRCDPSVTPSDWTKKASGTICGPVPGECEYQDTCDATGTCVDAGFKSPLTACNGVAGPCENQDYCDGVGGCTDNGFKSSSTVCRPADASGCDVPDYCTGWSGLCVGDSRQPAGTDCGVCRRCDANSVCVVNSLDHQDCGTCQVCNAGVCVNEGAGQDIKDECTPYTCSSYIWGASGANCFAYSSSTAANGYCSDAGACAAVADSCTGMGSNLGSCYGYGTAGDTACLACVPNTPAATKCYDDYGQHGCNIFDMCVAGTCIWSGSCPILYSPVDSNYAMEADIFPSGKLGLIITGGYRKPYPHDNYLMRYSPTAANGLIDLRIVEERQETNYLDQVKLYTVDGPPDRTVVSELLSVLPADNLPPEALLHTVDVNMANPVSMVREGTGEDLSAILADSDGNVLYLNNDNNVFDWQSIVIDLGDMTGAPQIKVVINARLAFPTTPDGYALARQLDPTNLRTRLEVQDAQGNWVVVPQALAILPRPKEFSRIHVFDVSDIFLTNNYKMRLSYLYLTVIDSIHVDITPDEPVAVTEVPRVAASLDYHGFSARSDLTANFIFYYDQAGARPFMIMPGNYTRYGDVTPLFDAVDDEFVIFGTGDEVQVLFSEPPAPPAGVERRFLLYTNGYYKTYKASTIDHTVEPLPFAAMSNFPYDESVETYPTDAQHEQYRATYNTRYVAP